MITLEKTSETFWPDIKVSYENFCPTREQRWAIDSGLTKLSDNCPYRSLISAKFIRRERKYSLEVLIQSCQDSFYSKSEAFFLEDCLVVVEKEIFSQLRPWRKKRFKGNHLLTPLDQI